MQMIKIPAKNNWLGFDFTHSVVITSLTGVYHSCNLQE
ncbi:hypothetical protein PUND_a0961 [Pseudoalteromonas undina]|nr:hypothetical protein PTET_a3088 [Pseudoalteromonas tetraodonis]KAF7765305.1 hypothetical protein PUND_a0961 [Pseudoalteromonas undina]